MAFLRLLGLVSVALAVASVSGTAQRTTGDQSSRMARTAHELSVEARLGARKRQCVSALGNAAFCDCLPSEDVAEIDLPRLPANSATVGHHHRRIVKRVCQF